jgi:hypothetical protein
MIPPLALKAGAILLVLLGAWGHGYTHGKGSAQRKAAAELQAATDAARAEENRRVMRLQENVDVAYLKQRQAESDARSLRAARDGLLDAAERAGASACNPTAAADGASGPARAVVPADLFRSIEERAEQLAGAADSARIAGQRCERAYDSLTVR